MVECNILTFLALTSDIYDITVKYYPDFYLTEQATDEETLFI